MPKQSLQILTETFVIHSLDSHAVIPPAVLAAPVYFIGKTEDEISLVIPDSIQIDSEEHDGGWRALELLGPLSLTMVGIMAQIGGVLAKANVSIFVLSTFDTDFFLVKDQDLQQAKEALVNDGYKIV